MVVGDRLIRVQDIVVRHSLNDTSLRKPQLGEASSAAFFFAATSSWSVT